MQIDACLASADCQPIFGCIQPCMMAQACISDCLAMYPNGQEAYMAVNACVQTSCQVECMQ